MSASVNSSARQPRKWTLEEDEVLRREVEAQIQESGEVRDWCKISSKFGGSRTNKDCRKRWHNSVMGGIKKGQWSKSEDTLLQRGVQQHGQRWTMVANEVGSRSADQCAKRWQQSLNPELNRSEWLEDEDSVLISAVQKFGRHWKDIQRAHFPSRSKNCIKNRYTVLVRRYQNFGVTLPGGGASPSEPSSPLASLSDDDNLPYTPSVHTNYLSGGNTVSSPESFPSTSNPWSWSSHPNVTATSSAPNVPSQPFAFALTPPQAQQQYPPHSHSSQWGNWPTPSVGSSQFMHPAAQTGQYTVPHASYTLHSNYPSMPTMMDSRLTHPPLARGAHRGAHLSSRPSRARTSTPSPGSSIGDPSQDNFDITYMSMTRPPQSDQYYQY